MLLMFYFHNIQNSLEAEYNGRLPVALPTTTVPQTSSCWLPTNVHSKYDTDSRIKITLFKNVKTGLEN